MARQLYWELLETLEKATDSEEEKPKVIPYLQYSTVFNLSQTEGIQAPTDISQQFEPLAVREQIIQGFTRQTGNHAYTFTKSLLSAGNG